MAVTTDLFSSIARELAEAMRDRQDYEAWKVLKEAGVAVQGDTPVVIDDAVCIKETDKALLIGIDMILVWVPKSALHASSQIKSIDACRSKLVLKFWFAKKVGLLL